MLTTSSAKNTAASGVPEQRGEQRAHAAQRRQAAVLIVHAQHLAEVLAEVAADLQRRALTSRAAARQMREERGEEDGGNEQDRQLAALMHRVEHRVGAHALRAQEAVERDDQHARERQRIKQRRDLRPQLGGVLHAEVKERADRAADRADERSGQQPFDQRFHIQHHMVGKPLQLLHRPFPFPSHFFTAISHRLNKVILHESTEKSSGEKAHRFIR